MKWKLFSIFIVLSFILAACGTTNEEGMNNDGNRDGNVQPTRYNEDLNNNRNNVRDTRDGMNNSRDNRNGNMTNDRNNRNNMGNNDRNNGQNNKRYDVSKDAANKITDEVDEIDHAYVLTTKNNAYVAAAFDADDRNDNKTENTNRNRTDQNNADRKRTNRKNGTDMTRNNGTNRNNNTNMADEDDRLTDDVKDQVSKIVKSVDNDIDNVYVSTNPDFLDLTTNYANDMDNGHPVRGFFDQMGDMVKRLFPQNK